MQALRPLHRYFVAVRRGDQAERGVLRPRAVSFSVVIHFSTQLTVQPRILTWHVVHSVSGTSLDGSLLPSLDNGDEAVALPWIGGRQKKGLAAGSRKRITKWSKNEEEEKEYEAEEERGYEVQKPPLAWVTLRSWQIQVTHLKTNWI